MKIRSSWLIRPLALLMAVVFRLWAASLRGRLHDPEKLIPPPLQSEQHYIYAFWHEYILFPMWLVGQGNVYVLISQHTDGQLVAEMSKMLLFSTVRGSTSKGGIKALREMKRVARRNHLAITPDGPRGPRRQVQLGMIYTASMTGLAIVPMGFSSSWHVRAKSWDSFCLPIPNTPITGVIGEPIRVPPNLSREQLEAYRQQVQAAMDRVHEQAEAWMETGQKPLELEPENVARPAA